jgi:hypothetical protein
MAIFGCETEIANITFKWAKRLTQRPENNVVVTKVFRKSTLIG